MGLWVCTYYLYSDCSHNDRISRSSDSSPFTDEFDEPCTADNKEGTKDTAKCIFLFSALHAESLVKFSS